MKNQLIAVLLTGLVSSHALHEQWPQNHVTDTHNQYNTGNLGRLMKIYEGQSQQQPDKDYAWDEQNNLLSWLGVTKTRDLQHYEDKNAGKEQDQHPPVSSQFRGNSEWCYLFHTGFFYQGKCRAKPGTLH